MCRLTLTCARFLMMVDEKSPSVSASAAGAALAFGFIVDLKLASLKLAAITDCISRKGLGGPVQRERGWRRQLRVVARGWALGQAVDGGSARR
jgi:hypothetical protein